MSAHPFHSWSALIYGSYNLFRKKKNEFMTMSFLCILFLLSKSTYFAFDIKIICWEKISSDFFSDHTISDIKQSVKILLALDFLRQTPQDNVRRDDWLTNHPKWHEKAFSHKKYRNIFFFLFSRQNARHIFLMPFSFLHFTLYSVCYDKIVLNKWLGGSQYKHECVPTLPRNM